MAAFQTTIFPTAAITGAGSQYFVVSTASMLNVFVVLGVGSGTISDLDVWLEAIDSPAGAIAGRQLADSIDANGTDVTTPRSNIVNNKATTAAETYMALYKNIPSGTYRVRWTLAGTTPSIPLTIMVAGK